MQFDHELLIGTFRNEAERLLSNLEELATELAERPDELTLVAEMFRCAHTLKGGALCVGFERVMLHSHELEGLFEAVTSHKLSPNRELSVLIFDAVGFLRNAVRVKFEYAAEPLRDEQSFIRRILDWIDGANDPVKLASTNRISPGTP